MGNAAGTRLPSRSDVLRRGPLAHGFAGGQRWTLGRIKSLIGKLLRIGYTVNLEEPICRAASRDG